MPVYDTFAFEAEWFPHEYAPIDFPDPGTRGDAPTSDPCPIQMIDGLRTAVVVQPVEGASRIVDGIAIDRALCPDGRRCPTPR